MRYIPKPSSYWRKFSLQSEKKPDYAREYPRERTPEQLRAAAARRRVDQLRDELGLRAAVAEVWE